MKRGELGHFVNSQKQLENYSIPKYGKKRIVKVEDFASSERVFPSNNERPSTAPAKPFRDIIAHANDEENYVTKGKKIFQKDTEQNATITGAFFDKFSGREYVPPKRTARKELEMAKLRLAQEIEKEEKKKRAQEKIMDESKTLCEQENKLYTELVSKQPHATTTPRLYPPKRVDPSSPNLQEAINVYYKSRHIWKYKEKDFGTFKIN